MENDLLYGKKIADSIAHTESDVFFSKVYKGEKCIVKIASEVIIENEFSFLNKLEKYNHFPNIIQKDNSSIKISLIEGVQFDEYFQNKRNYKIKDIKTIIKKGFYIQRILIENDILHRDIRDANFIVLKTRNHIQLFLIDFGWATCISHRDNELKPIGLGDKFRYGDGEFSDLYSFGLIVKQYFGRFSFVQPIIKDLLQITPTAYDDRRMLLENLDKTEKQLDGFINLMDVCALLTYKNPVVEKIAKRIHKYF